MEVGSYLALVDEVYHNKRGLEGQRGIGGKRLMYRRAGDAAYT
jgi:hypothetical protein